MIKYRSLVVEHLVKQLIKLQQEYDNRPFNAVTGKSEIDKAMKNINKALESVLTQKESSRND